MEEMWPGWETVRLIGEGSFGAVYAIKREVFGDAENAAIKRITIPQNSSVKITINSVYRGTHYEDTVISDIQFTTYRK